MLDIVTREAIAVDKVLHAFKDLVKDCRVDVVIDNLAVMHAWNNQGGKGHDLNNAIKALFFTTMDLNILLHMWYVPSQQIRRMPLLAGCDPSTIRLHRRSGMKYN